MTHAYVRHDSFICDISLMCIVGVALCICDVPHLYVTHDWNTRMWMSHVTPTLTRHAHTHMSSTHVECHVTCHTYGWVISTWHVTCMDELCHTHTLTRHLHTWSAVWHVTRMDESCHTHTHPHEIHTWGIAMWRDTRMHESCHTLILSCHPHMRSAMWNATRMNESCHTHAHTLTHTHTHIHMWSVLWHVTRMNEVISRTHFHTCAWVMSHTHTHMSSTHEE